MIRLRWSLMTAEKLLKAAAVSGRRRAAAPGRSRARPKDGSGAIRRSASQTPRDGTVPAQRLDSVFRAGRAVAAVDAEQRARPASGRRSPARPAVAPARLIPARCRAPICANAPASSACS